MFLPPSDSGDIASERWFEACERNFDGLNFRRFEENWSQKSKSFSDHQVRLALRKKASSSSSNFDLKRKREEKTHYFQTWTRGRTRATNQIGIFRVPKILAKSQKFVKRKTLSLRRLLSLKEKEKVNFLGRSSTGCWASLGQKFQVIFREEDNLFLLEERKGRIL